MADPKNRTAATDPVHDLFVRARDAFKRPNRILSEGTGRGRYSADKWFSGDRTPQPEVLLQVARNVRRRASLLQDIAAEFDTLAVEIARGEPGVRTQHSDGDGVPESDALPDGGRGEAGTAEPDVEALWTPIHDLSEFLAYVASLGGAPIPGVGRPFGELTQQEQQELAARVILTGV